MVLEEFLKKSIFRKNHLALLAGFISVIICSLIVFLARKYVPLGNDTSVILLFFVTMMLTPALARLLTIEEKVERSYGISNFFRNHRKIFELYVFLLIGVFLGFLAVGFFLATSTSSDSKSFDQIFSYQLNYLDKSSINDVIGQQQAKQDTISLIKSYEPSPGRVIGIAFSNLIVFIVSFLLSFFYGAGAIFLIVMNASVFATFLVFVLIFVAKSASQALGVTGAFMLHLTPEISGFLFAAIAGGILSKAALKERIFSQGFKNVAKDALIILGIAIALIITAAIIEVYVSAPILKGII